MAGADYSLNLSITATNSAMGAISSLIRGLGPVGIAAAAVGVAVVGIGVASVKMAADYQQGMNKIQALTGSSNAQMAQYDAGLKKLAVDAGVAPTALADGLYNVISAGYSGGDAMKVFTLATQDSKIGMTDAGTTTKALTSVMANFKVKVSDATRVNGEMLQTVTLGNSTFAGYANNITKAASTSAQFGVSMETMNAAWATLTANGIRAGQATTDYDQSLTVMYGNIGTVTKSLHKNGIAFSEAKFNALDYGGKVKMLNAALEEAHKKHLKVTGATVQASQAIKTISDHIKMYNNDLGTLSDKQKMANKTAESWATTQDGFNQQMSRAKAALDVLMISIGNQLLPVLTNMAKQLAPMLLQFSDWLIKSGALKIAASFLAGALQGLVSTIVWLATTLGNIISFFQQNQWAVDALGAVLIAFVGIVVPMLVTALIGMATAAWAAAIPVIALALPFIALGLVVAAVVFGIIMAVQHWGAIMDWISGKTEQTNLKIQISDSQAAVKKDHQQKKSAQDTLKNLDKEKADILAKIKNEHDAAKRMDDQHQLEMLQNQIDAQNARIRAADADAARQKAKQIQLHADLLEAQKAWYVRFEDANDAWTKNMENAFDGFWLNIFGQINAGTKKAEDGFDKWWLNLFGGINTATRNMENAFDNFWLNIFGQINSGTARAENTFDSFFLTLAGKFNTWVAGAVNWGRDLIQNLINGINSMLGNLSGTVGNVASTIAQMLHFTKPEKGPLRTVDTWMPHLGDTLILGLNNISPKLQAAAIRAAASVAGPIKGSTDGAMPSHIFDFIGSNYSGYASGMATTAKREEAADDKSARLAAAAARHAAVVARQENALDAHIQKLENHYNIVVHAHGKGKWTRADATELAKLLAEEARLQGKNPQTASGRRN